MRLSKVTLVVLSTMALSLAGMTMAHADTIFVGPNDSIQAAVDQAKPGDTILVSRGTHAESVLITKDDLTLIGAGATDQGTVLVPPATTDGVCSQPGATNGICIFGDQQSGSPVVGVTVKGFEISGFSLFGIFGLLSNDHTVANNYAINNGEYGVACFVCSGGTYTGNTAVGSGAAGFYQGDSPNANSTMSGNVAMHNGFGFFFRDAANGTVYDNTATSNCVGFMMLDTGSPDVMGHWDMYDNNLVRNNRACPASEEGPALSGLGLAMLGGDGNNVHENTIWRNVASGETYATAGVFIDSAHPFGGLDPVNNTFESNTAYGNGGWDFRYTRAGTGNRFVDNACGRSNPRRICG